jgi:hypothetical protein
MGARMQAIYERQAEDRSPTRLLTSCGGKAGTVLLSESQSTAGMDLQGDAAIGRKIRPAFDSCHLAPTPHSLAWDAQPGLYAFL